VLLACFSVTMFFVAFRVHRRSMRPLVKGRTSLVRCTETGSSLTHRETCLCLAAIRCRMKPQIGANLAASPR
jgi:hypothetical protein